MLNRIILLPFITALNAVASVAVAAPNDPTGVWLTQDGRARIRLEKCGPAREQVCGYAVWLKTPNNSDGSPRTDVYNVDPDKKNRPLLGHQLLAGLKTNEDDRFEGQIYNSEDGKSYKVTIWLEGPSELKLKGCLVAFLCSTQSWSRVTDVAAGQVTSPAGAPKR